MLDQLKSTFAYPRVSENVRKYIAKLFCIPDIVEKPLFDPPKQRALTEGELYDLMPSLIDRHGMCAKFMLLTGMRQRTVTSSQWSQIDLEDKTWTVPAANLKDTRALSSRLRSPRNDSTVPLSRQAVFLLHRVKEAEIQRRQLNGIATSIAPDDLVFVGSQAENLETVIDG